jgi:hypothetical protein
MARDGAPLTIRMDYLTLGPSTGEMLHASGGGPNGLAVGPDGALYAPHRTMPSRRSIPL